MILQERLVSTTRGQQQQNTRFEYDVPSPVQLNNKTSTQIPSVRFNPSDTVHIIPNPEKSTTDGEKPFQLAESFKEIINAYVASSPSRTILRKEDIDIIYQRHKDRALANTRKVMTTLHEKSPFLNVEVVSDFALETKQTFISQLKKKISTIAEDVSNPAALLYSTIERNRITQMILEMEKYIPLVKSCEYEERIREESRALEANWAEIQTLMRRREVSGDSSLDVQIQNLSFKNLHASRRRMIYEKEWKNYSTNERLNINSYYTNLSKRTRIQSLENLDMQLFNLQRSLLNEVQDKKEKQHLIEQIRLRRLVRGFVEASDHITVESNVALIMKFLDIMHSELKEKENDIENLEGELKKLRAKLDYDAIVARNQSEENVRNAEFRLDRLRKRKAESEALSIPIDRLREVAELIEEKENLNYQVVELQKRNTSISKELQESKNSLSTLKLQINSEAVADGRVEKLVTVPSKKTRNVASPNGQVEKLRLEIKLLTQQKNEELSRKTEEFERVNQQYAKDIAKLQNETIDLKNKNASNERQIAQIIREKEEEVAKLREERVLFQKGESTVTGVYDAISREYKERTLELEERNELLEHRLTQELEKNKLAEREFSSSEKEYLGKIERYKRMIAQIRDDIPEIENENNAELASLLNVTRTNLNAQDQLYEDRLKVKEKVIEALQKIQNEKTSELDQLKLQHKEKTEKFEYNTNLLAGELNELKRKLEDLEKTKDSLLSQVAKKDQRIQVLEKELRSNENKLSKKEQKLRDTQNDVETRAISNKKTIEEYTNLIAKLKDTNESLLKRLEANENKKNEDESSSTQVIETLKNEISLQKQIFNTERDLLAYEYNEKLNQNHSLRIDLGAFQHENSFLNADNSRLKATIDQLQKEFESQRQELNIAAAQNQALLTKNSEQYNEIDSLKAQLRNNDQSTAITSEKEGTVGLIEQISNLSSQLSKAQETIQIQSKQYQDIVTVQVRERKTFQDEIVRAKQLQEELRSNYFSILKEKQENFDDQLRRAKEEVRLLDNKNVDDVKLENGQEIDQRQQVRLDELSNEVETLKTESRNERRYYSKEEKLHLDEIESLRNALDANQKLIEELQKESVEKTSKIASLSGVVTAKQNEVIELNLKVSRMLEEYNHSNKEKIENINTLIKIEQQTLARERQRNTQLTETNGRKDRDLAALQTTLRRVKTEYNLLSVKEKELRMKHADIAKKNEQNELANVELINLVKRKAIENQNLEETVQNKKRKVIANEEELQKTLYEVASLNHLIHDQRLKLEELQANGSNIDEDQLYKNKERELQIAFDKQKAAFRDETVVRDVDLIIRFDANGAYTDQSAEMDTLNFQRRKKFINSFVEQLSKKNAINKKGNKVKLTTELDYMTAFYNLMISERDGKRVKGHRWNSVTIKQFHPGLNTLIELELFRQIFFDAEGKANSFSVIDQNLRNSETYAKFDEEKVLMERVARNEISLNNDSKINSIANITEKLRIAATKHDNDPNNPKKILQTINIQADSILLLLTTNPLLAQLYMNEEATSNSNFPPFIPKVTTFKQLKKK